MNRVSEYKKPPCPHYGVNHKTSLAYTSSDQFQMEGGEIKDNNYC